MAPKDGSGGGGRVWVCGGGSQRLQKVATVRLGSFYRFVFGRWQRCEDVQQMTPLQLVAYLCWLPVLLPHAAEHDGELVEALLPGGLDGGRSLQL